MHRSASHRTLQALSPKASWASMRDDQSRAAALASSLRHSSSVSPFQFKGLDGRLLDPADRRRPVRPRVMADSFER